ncbi:MAG: bifunctional nuclease family protein [Bdellovibrionaceae bacterium]|nr:bifunctional nuclease family protein [Pseudobdellovibrionaceae bacterium]
MTKTEKNLSSPVESRRLRKKIVSRHKRSRLEEMFVYGITLGSSQRRPILVLKDRDSRLTLPVWLNPVDASYAMRDHSHQAYAVHTVALAMMSRFGVRLDRCVFTEVKGHHQFVTLHFAGNPQLEKLEVRADDAMSLCLATSARFFATQEFVERCRDVDAEMLELEAGLNLKPEIGSKNHPYVM